VKRLLAIVFLAGAAQAQPIPDTLEQRLLACAACHGKHGEGLEANEYQLSDREVAAVVTYIRGAWGNAGAAVSPAEVASGRGVPLD
jgi:mono/diheme cytochrome c family protein